MKESGRSSQHVFELIAVSVAFVIVNLLSQAWQKPISYNAGKGWDGGTYYGIAAAFSEGQPAKGPAPFVYRIGTPALATAASKIFGRLFGHSDLLTAFKVVNGVANVVTTGLLVIWLRLFLGDWKLRVLLVLLFLMQWHAPVRGIYYYPAYVDPWFFALALAGLIGIQKTGASGRGLAWLALLVLVGTVFRETMFVVPVAFLFAANPIPNLAAMSRQFAKWRVDWRAVRFFVPIGASVVGFLLVRLVAAQTDNYSFAGAAFHWLYAKSLPSYCEAWFNAYGPVIAIAIYGWRRVASFLWTNQFMLVFLIVISLLAWVGGTDTERILYWSMPVVYLLIGLAIADNVDLLRSWRLLLVLGVGQLVSQRVFWTVPDYPNNFVSPLPILTVPTSHLPFTDLLSGRGSQTIEGTELLEYLLLTAALLWWLSRRSLRRATP